MLTSSVKLTRKINREPVAKSSTQPSIEEKTDANQSIDVSVEDVPQYERILSRSKLMLEGIRPIVKDVLNQLVDRMREHQLRLSPQTIVPIVKIAMEIVEKTALKGIQKRELVNEMILHILEASPMSDEQRELCRTLVDTEIIGNTVDVIVQASKGSLNINTVQELAESTTSCCFAFFARK